MFNSYTSNSNANQNIKINAVSGAILKNHPKSWFERFHLKSKIAEELLKEGGHKAQVTNSVESEYQRGRYYYTSKNDQIMILSFYK